MKIINILDDKTYLKEVIELTIKEWGTYHNKEELDTKVGTKLNKILNNNDKLISLLGLIDNATLIGFISLLKYDGEERTDLTPWYGTMFVKEEYRNKGHSKILNKSILQEAKRLGYHKVYLKSKLINYYEKFGAKYIDTLSNGEKLYYIDIL